MTHNLMPSKKRLNNDDNMIPMINIVFLLLIFFMVAGHIQTAQTQDLELPISKLNSPRSDQVIDIQINKNNHLYFNGELISLTQLNQKLSLFKNKNMPLALKVDKHLHAIELDKVLKIIRSKNIVQVTIYAQVMEI